MFITADNKILIKELRLSKKWEVKKCINEFRDNNWRYSIWWNLLRKIDKTGDVKRYPCSGRPRTMRVPDNISMVEDLILSQDNDDNHGRPIGYLWCNDIGLRVFRRERVQILQIATKQRRLTHCQNLLRTYTPIKAGRIWFSHKNIFRLAALLNHQNFIVYSNKYDKNILHWIDLFNKKFLQQTRYGLWIHFIDWKKLVAVCSRGSDCWWRLLLENTDETSLTNKKIDYLLDKVHGSTRWALLPHS